MASLSPAQYWEWRTTIEEMHHSETKIKLSQMMAAGLDKDIEIQKLKLLAYKHVMNSHQENHDKIKKDYEAFKLKLEESIGVSLTNKVIDDVTFEVKELD